MSSAVAPTSTPTSSSCNSRKSSIARRACAGRNRTGFIERFHRTLLDEHLRVAGRTTWYETVDEMQKDLDVFLDTYNRKRLHRGRGMEGRTPYQVFKAGLKEAKKAAKQPRTEKDTRAA